MNAIVRNIAVKVLTVSNNHIHYKLLYCIQAVKTKASIQTHFFVQLWYNKHFRFC